MFKSKQIHSFQRGDFAKMKEGTVFPDLNITIDWEGNVLWQRDDAVKVALDAISLRGFSDELIEHYRERGDDPYTIIIPRKDLEPSEERATFKEMLVAQDELIDRIYADREKQPYEEVVDRWVRHFHLSDHYNELSEQHQEDSVFLIDTFANYMYNYEDKLPKKWTVIAAEEVCLTWLPRKVSADIATFEAYGPVLYCFFKFLDDEKYLKTKRLQELMLDIKDDIVAASQDSSNWGMAKSFMMGAVDSGLDLDDKNALDAYLAKQQAHAISEIMEKQKRLNSPEEKKKRKKLKGLWNNQKINVQYPDGRILNNVKFKDVKKDLLNGECELLDG